MSQPAIEHLIHQEVARAANEAQKAAMVREFHVISDDCYSFTVPDLGLELTLDRVRRERSELVGELSVSCDLPGVKPANGSVISAGDFNVSSIRARSDRAKLLASRANIPNLDWIGVVEAFCQKILDADRRGQPVIDLRQVQKPSDDSVYNVLGLVLPKNHATILFEDGGCGKSMIGLFIAGKLIEQGCRVLLADWELGAEDHRDRLERLFPDGMPRVLYARCERPLVHEADRLRRIVRENSVDYVLYDSIAFASDGPPESAEVAGRYLRAVRSIGAGSLHIAHTSKSIDADKKPFGSVFWHNGARMTWFAKLAEETSGSDILRVGLFNRKSNLGRLRPAIGFSIAFDQSTTAITRSDIADSPDLSGQLSVRERMRLMLRHRSMDQAALAEQIDADIDTVRRTMRRYKQQFTVIEGGRIGLLQK